MPRRKIPLVNGEVYHVFTKSIAEYQIFTSIDDYRRFLDAVRYYQIKKPPEKFSRFLKLKEREQNTLILTQNPEKVVKIIAYCLMPTHMHMILQQTENDGIATYVGKTLESYTKYFNNKYNRKGPLWENRFRNVLVTKDEQLLHLTRYIHLNPVTAYLVDKPELWQYSSYHEYIGAIEINEKICEFDKLLDIEPLSYKEFVNTRIDDQRKLALIKKLIADLD
jgi:putative transposase